jgi:hypothetical protein
MPDNTTRPVLDAASRAAIELRRERFARLVSAFTGLPLSLARKAFRPLPARRAGAFRRVCVPLALLAVLGATAGTSSTTATSAEGRTSPMMWCSPPVCR